MLLALTEMQEMIASSVIEFLSHEYDFLKRAHSLQAPHSLSPTVWSAFADMGWLGLPLSEEDGGIGGRSMEAGLLMRAFGRYLVVEPFVGSVLLGTRLLAELGTQAQKAEWLPALLAGQHRCVLAHDELGNSDPWSARNTRLRASAGGLVLQGAKTLVAGAAGANSVLVSAQADDGSLQLVWLALDAPGLHAKSCRTLDGGWAADLVFEAVAVEQAQVLGTLADTSNLLGRVLGEALVSACWEASGAMQAVMEQTASYTQERVQFGQPIGKFQVVQHRLAEMAVFCEEALAACQLATLTIERDPSSAPTMACMVKSKVGRGAKYVAQEAVQLHGAMGVSDELAIASYFRKLLAFTQQHGGTAWFGERYGQEMFASSAWRHSRTLAG